MPYHTMRIYRGDKDGGEYVDYEVDVESARRLRPGPWKVAREDLRLVDGSRPTPDYGENHGAPDRSPAEGEEDTTMDMTSPPHQTSSQPIAIAASIMAILLLVPFAAW